MRHRNALPLGVGSGGERLEPSRVRLGTPAVSCLWGRSLFLSAADPPCKPQNPRTEAIGCDSRNVHIARVMHEGKQQRVS